MTTYVFEKRVELRVEASSFEEAQQKVMEQTDKDAYDLQYDYVSESEEE